MKTRCSLVLLLIVLTCVVHLYSKSISSKLSSYRDFNKDIKLELKVVELPLEYLEDIKGTPNSSRIKKGSGLSAYSMTRLWNEARKDGSRIKILASNELFLNNISPGFVESGMNYSYIEKYNAEISGLVPVINKLYSGLHGVFQVMGVRTGSLKKNNSVFLSWAILNCQNAVENTTGKVREGFFRTAEFSGNEIELPKVKGFSAASTFIVKDGEIRLLFSCTKKAGSLDDTIMTAVFVRTSFIDSPSKYTSNKYNHRGNDYKWDPANEKLISLLNLFDFRRSLTKFKKNYGSVERNRTLILSGKIIDLSSELLLKLSRNINDSTFIINDLGLRILSEAVRKKEALLLDAFDITGTNHTEMIFLSGIQTSYIDSFKAFSKKFESIYRIGNIPVVKKIFSGIEFDSNINMKANESGIRITGGIMRKSDIVFHQSEVKYQSFFSEKNNDVKIEKTNYSSKIEKPEMRSAPIVFNILNLLPEKTIILIGSNKPSVGKNGLRNEILLLKMSDR